MKVSGHSKANILSPAELDRLFSEGLMTPRDRALFAICLFTACRVSEALALQTTDVRGGMLVLRKSTTKGKLRTREIDIGPPLAKYLEVYNPKPGFLFPGIRPGKPLTRYAADKILRAAFDRVGIHGCSTHSFRRTALTMMSDSGVPLRHIQEISGHSDLGVLQAYLEVTPEQRRKAVGAIKW